MFENRVPHVLSGDYTPLSAVDIFVKDLGMVLDTARTSKFPLPLSAAAHQMFMMASTAGHGGEDDCGRDQDLPRHRTAGGQGEVRERDDDPIDPIDPIDPLSLLGCIADDFTGATDLANTLVRNGMRTVQTIGVPASGGR